MRARWTCATAVASGVLVACAAGRAPAGALEPRFLAVHNAFAGLGLAQVGPIHQGSLAEGKEERVSLDLPAGCTTVVALGGEGVRDLDAQLLDPQARPLAHDTTSEPEAVLRACPDAAGTFVLVVRAAAGAGSWVAAAWQGGAVGGGASSAAAVAATAPTASGTCEAPIPLSPGTVSGSTARGEDANTGSCERSDAREIVYVLDVQQRQRVVLEVEAHFDSVLYVRKETCGDADAEVDCNDDAPGSGRNRSRIERVLDPGKYFVFVDGYNQEAGSYKLTLTTSDVVSLNDACRRAPVLLPGTTASGTTSGGADDARASCGGGAEGADAAFRFEVPVRERVRLVERSMDVSPVVHLRRACADEQSEVACADAVGSQPAAVVARELDPGAYTVFADGRERDPSGAFDLSLEAAPLGGTGVPGEGCGDASPLALASTASASGDTFAARDDVATTCGGAGAPDVVYRFDLPRRARVLVQIESEESPHVLAAWRRCGERSAELACGKTVDAVLAPGTYFLGVDGLEPGAFGRFQLAWSVTDVSAQATACGAATALSPGRSVSASTANAPDRFASSCAGGGDAASTGPDRLYRFTLASRSSVHLGLRGASFDAVLALRRACADAPGPDVELSCETEPGARALSIDRTLEAGTYWVVVEGQGASDAGGFTLDYGAVSAR